MLVEKPMAASLEEADRLIVAAARAGRILQIGHVERFNPAVVAAQKIVQRPMFFEVHRLGIFTPRSLDIDVVYDVMIHDLDILLSLVDAPVVDLKAVGIPVITDKVDIAHARVEFETGTVANITASRVSTERVRKMRFFQEHEYVSLDFTRQDALRISVTPGNPQPESVSRNWRARSEEPLHAELRAFLESVRTRQPALVDGAAGRRALALADRVMAGILDHARRVQLGAFSPQEHSMIPRTLVPVNVRPVDPDEAKKAPHRLTTYMDDRTVVPSGLSDAPPLDGKTTIPSHLPLGVLVDRTLVPRGMAAKPIETSAARFDRHAGNSRFAHRSARVHRAAHTRGYQGSEHAPEMTAELREIVEPDIFTTGDANLLIEPEDKTTAKSEVVRVVGSVTFHVALILFLIFAPKIAAHAERGRYRAQQFAHGVDVFAAIQPGTRETDAQGQRQPQNLEYSCAAH